MNLSTKVLGATAAAMLVLAGSPARLAANPVPPTLVPFLEQHCFECHDDDISKGDLNLLELEFKPWNSANFATWERVYDRVRLGEMPPPKKKERPAPAARTGFLGALRTPLAQADRKQVEERGRVRTRRLTRREYEHTLHDLLGIDLPLSEFLPEDPATHGFETVASGQQFSHHHLARYLEAADRALGEAFQRAVDGDTKWTKTFPADTLGATVRGRGNYRGPQLLKGESIVWPIRIPFYGRMTATEIPADGWYRVTLKGVRAINPRHGVVWGNLQSGACFSNSPMLHPIGCFEATPKPRDLSFEAWIRKGHILRLHPSDAALKTAPSLASGGAVAYKGDIHIKKGFQGIAVRGIEVERVYPNAARDEVRAKLFGHRQPGFDLKGLEGPKRSAELAAVIRPFAERAFRRPVGDEQLEPYLRIGLDQLAKDRPPADVLRAAYRAMLCSPRFLTLPEAPGKLDDHAVAARLSYALWNSLPDPALQALAREGRLRDPAILSRQIDRMLADPKSERFIASFTDQWLNLRDIDFTSPDERMFRATWDPIVRQSIVMETRAFFRELLRGNRSVRHFVQSDFAMLNERLARHYNLGDTGLKPGHGLQRVRLNNPVRSGLMTQASVLKVTANGTTTSPVMRGIWVNERLLGTHIPPPPPGVPAIEPDIRGAVSIRDQLAKHRDSESCASCHTTIDPSGFALENFDPVGRWRTKYGRQDKRAAPVDPAGVTPDGRAFDDIVGWKAIYRERPDLLARGFAEQIVTYATGAPPRFSDRDALARIVAASADQDHGVRTLLKQTIASEIFLIK